VGYFLSFALLFDLYWAADMVQAAPSSWQNSTLQLKGEIPEWIRPTTFQYSSRGKPDPFQKFIKKRPLQGVVKKEPSLSPGTEQKKETHKEILSPLETIEPSQLKLVGIIWRSDSPQKAYGLVELPDGKGFIVNKGTRIGQNEARVFAITPKTVVIHQEEKSLYGEKMTRKVILKLKNSKEEEGQ
jgi:type IV pilus assembly protein PilP